MTPVSVTFTVKGNFDSDWGQIVTLGDLVTAIERAVNETGQRYDENLDLEEVELFVYPPLEGLTGS